MYTVLELWLHPWSVRVLEHARSCSTIFQHLRRIVNVSLSYNSPKSSRTVSLFIDTEQVDNSEY